MTLFADRLACFQSEHAEGVKRIRAQAEMRARQNGIDPVEAAMLAADMFTLGCSHEEIVSIAAGPYRRVA